MNLKYISYILLLDDLQFGPIRICRNIALLAMAVVSRMWAVVSRMCLFREEGSWKLQKRAPHVVLQKRMKNEQ